MYCCSLILKKNKTIENTAGNFITILIGVREGGGRLEKKKVVVEEQTGIEGHPKGVWTSSSLLSSN